MKVGFQLVLFLLCLNLVAGLLYTINAPGTSYSNPVTGVGNASDYEARFNPEEMMNKTQPDIIGDFPYLGNIYGTLMYLWNAINFIIMGFPALLEQYAGLIPLGTGRTVYTALTLVLRAIFMFIILGWLFQVFTGRQTQD